LASIEDIVARLQTLHPRLIDLTLDRMTRILAQLGHPERKLPPVIHVAGTNGKGSVIAFLRAMLEADGKRVHVYTSPHLVRFNERFRLAGQLASDDELAAALAECERVNAGAALTLFEITTAAGLLMFSRHPADVLLLEVGLGGRLDATNVVDEPLATVITPVALDHAEYLGENLDQVAAEKAGIIKEGVPVIVGLQQRDALSVIGRRASRLNAPLHIAGEDWTAGEEHGRLVFQDEERLLDLPAPKLYGRHQFDNAGLAVATLRAIPAITPRASAFEAGVVNAEWPARMQRLTAGTLFLRAPQGGELWLDGGHNPDGGRAIAAALADLEERVSRPLVLIVGMLASKDCAGFLRNFSGLTRRIIAIPIEGQKNALSPDEIAGMARGVGIPAMTRSSIKAALDAVERLELDPPPRILITGSLYLAGEVLKQNDGAPPG
jgi:dihydrofolate synthase / folylpolyglutamate synthase